MKTQKRAKTQKQPARKGWAELPPRDWAEEQAFNVAREIRRLRDSGGGKLSTLKLSQRTADLGYEVTRDVISDLENGRRRYVTVPEITVLARALNTTPIALLYPDPINSETLMLPKLASGQAFAMQWFCGHVDAASMAEQAVCDDAAAYGRNLRRTELAREIWRLDEQRAALMRDRVGKTGADKRDIMLAIGELTRQIDKLKAADDGR